MKPSLKCQICGHDITLTSWRIPATCSDICYKEYDWRRTLAILKKDYYPDPKEQDVRN